MGLLEQAIETVRIEAEKRHEAMKIEAEKRHSELLQLLTAKQTPTESVPPTTTAGLHPQMSVTGAQQHLSTAVPLPPILLPPVSGAPPQFTAAFPQFPTSPRPRQKSPTWSSSQEVNLGQRLEAKLNAAEQKRLSIISKSQKRLARLEELRQAATSGVKMQVEKKRSELGRKVESRVQKAGVNRMLIMKSRRQGRAARKGGTAHSWIRRMTQESKYKECVQATIHQKRVAAERKRLGLLEAEKSKAREWSSRVQRVANSIHSQKEMERFKKMMGFREEKGEKEVLIAWRGASKGETTWEPVEDIKQQFPKYHLEDKVVFRGGSNDTNPTNPKWGRVLQTPYDIINYIM